MSKDILFMKIIEKLELIHTDMPDLRFGEVVQNALDCACNGSNVSLCQVSTKQVLTSLDKYYLSEMKKRKNEVQE